LNGTFRIGPKRARSRGLHSMPQAPQPGQPPPPGANEAPLL
jgi:hypothetical protein